MESDVRSPKRSHLVGDMQNTSPEKFESYDVFISHRGPDTKTGFVSFLYKDLIAAGLRPFLDCRSIDMGEYSWECIQNSIRKIPIAVVIFSESFAESSWCLRELHVMLHCPGVKVLPVFYNVRPSEVRYPYSGQLKSGLEKLSRRHDKTVIEEWRADLEQAAQIKGWEHAGADKRLEGELVTEVVGKILELANKALPLAVGDYVVGVKEVAEKIIGELEEKKKVLMLGLWGMGGIGKSTLARELYNRLRERFESACYVEDVAEKVGQGGVVKVQNHILKDLFPNECVEISGKSKGKMILEERLCRKRILMVLDDVRKSEEMEFWISRKMLGEGSMCIVTSRNRSVFETSDSFDVEHEVYIHDVEALNGVDSERVFACYAFGGFWKVKGGFEELVTSISKACGGVPLMLKVCGALLKNKENVEMWEEVRKKLSCGALMDDKRIFECLQISYDDLSEEEQEMFLDIACALIGERRDWAVRVWKSLEWSAELGVCSLIEKALIRVDEDGKFRMHDHLRDMGREIVRKKRASEGVIRRLWMPESLRLVREKEGLPDSLRTLTLSDDYDRDYNLDYKLDLSHMKDLCILIYNTTMTVISIPRKLRWFTCVFVKWATFLIAPHNNELVILSFWGSRIQSLPESFVEVSNLEVLNLSLCWNLSMLPESFGGLSKLQELTLEDSGIRSLRESFGELGNLEVLNLSRCGKLSMLPESFGGLRKLRELTLERSGIRSLRESFGELGNLEVLNLSRCGKLSMLPESFGGLRKLRELTLERSGIRSLRESFGELGNLEVLNLSRCGNLSFLPESFGGLRKLRELTLERSGIKSLPGSFGELSNLEVLNLSWCENLSMLPESFGGLSKLWELTLERSGIRNLPESFGELGNLEVLNLSWCENLSILTQSFGGLAKLQELALKCSEIQSFPESFEELCNLEVFNLMRGKLRKLPESFGGLRKLRELAFERSGIKSLPESFGELGNLEMLNLSLYWKLSMLPESFGGLRKLRELTLERSGIKSLPESFGELSNLEVLNLSWCENLSMRTESFGVLGKLTLDRSDIQSLPESFGELGNLEVLNLRRCENLSFLPESFGGLRKLRELTLERSGIKILPESFGELSNLEVLNLSWCENLSMLTESFGVLGKLRELTLDRSGIQSLPESFGELGNLEVLNLRRCENLNFLPESFGGLRKLRELTLERSGIQRLPESFGELSNLEVLNLSWCGKLSMLPESFGELGNLEVLNLSWCGKLSMLPESFGELGNLEVLNLSWCGKLSMLPESFGELGNLEVLNLSWCENLCMLPDSFGVLRKLRELTLQRSRIQSFRESFRELGNLDVFGSEF